MQLHRNYYSEIIYTVAATSDLRYYFNLSVQEETDTGSKIQYMKVLSRIYLCPEKKEAGLASCTKTNGQTSRQTNKQTNKQKRLFHEAGTGFQIRFKPFISSPYLEALVIIRPQCTAFWTF